MSKWCRETGSERLAPPVSLPAFPQVGGGIRNGVVLDVTQGLLHCYAREIRVGPVGVRMGCLFPEAAAHGKEFDKVEDFGLLVLRQGLQSLDQFGIFHVVAPSQGG